jgi:dolichol-phosphate mannosyltransferase
MKNPPLSVAAPAFNEAEGIEALVETWRKYLNDQMGREKYEIVICNDGSSDDTGLILDRMASKYSELRPVHHGVNQGASVALATAIKNTTGDWVLLIDSDGQFLIENFGRMSEEVQAHGALAVIGVREAKRDSVFARFGTWSSGFVCNIFFGTRYRDFNSAFKLVRGDILRGLNLEAKGLNYSTEISARLAESGVKMREVDITHSMRVGGMSSRRAIRGSVHRFLFVMYLGFRRVLIKMKILCEPRQW